VALEAGVRLVASARKVKGREVQEDSETEGSREEGASEA
jgi:hypothetical protein